MFIEYLNAIKNKFQVNIEHIDPNFFKGWTFKKSKVKTIYTKIVLWTSDFEPNCIVNPSIISLLCG